MSKIFNILTIFPNMISQSLQEGLVGQAFKNGKAQLNLVNPRDFTFDLHKTVDDRPYGGGDGMVFLAEPFSRALASLGEGKGKVVFLSPQGMPWSDQMAREWAQDQEPVTLVCGRYGGIDQRFIEVFVDEEISIGDYILSGGELGSLVIMDSVVRFLPEVLGNPLSTHLETFAEGLLECPLLTRPRVFMDLPVPEILLSGHHVRMEAFRQDVSLVRTRILRPDLLKQLGVPEMSVVEAARRLCALPERELKSLGLAVNTVRQIAENKTDSLMS
jgi:tRNA (guanine37-N1)-methyltransferase